VTAGCARCGNCCENITCDNFAVTASWSSSALADTPDPGTDDGWAYWNERGWTEAWSGTPADIRDRAARAYDPAGRLRADADFITKYWHSPDGTHYECSMFNPVTRECMAHDRRPPVCRDYPWYGEEPSAERGQHMGATCSYLWDLPRSERPDDARPLIPLTVI
jgi:Fe-S-cluster containining protein